MKLDVGMLTHDLKSISAYARKVEALGYDVSLVLRDPARSVPAARGRRRGHVVDPSGHRDRRGVPAEPA